MDFEGGVLPVPLERSKGGVGKFTNVSKDLLYVDYCAAWDAGADLIPGTEDDVCIDVKQIALFSDALLSYYWSRWRSPAGGVEGGRRGGSSSGRSWWAR